MEVAATLTLLSRRRVRGYFAITLEASYERPLGARAAPPATAMYEEERLEIREDPHNPDRYRICARAGCITENAFVRRYRARTGARELDDFDRDHWADVRWLGAATGGALGAIFIPAGIGLTTIADHRGTRLTERNEARGTGGVIAGIGVAALAMGVAFLVTPSGGTTTDHFLTKSQAMRFVARYNRALR